MARPERCKHGFLSTAPRCPEGCVFIKRTPVAKAPGFRARSPRPKVTRWGYLGGRIGEVSR